jgi:integrase
MGRRSTTNGVEAKGDRIQVTFTWRGKRLRPTLALRPTPRNLLAAERLRTEIVGRIRNSTFDIAEYFPGYEPAGLVVAPVERPTFRRASELWLKSLDIAWSTQVGYRKNLQSYWLPVLGERPVADISFEDLVNLISEFVDGGISKKTRNNILISLRGTFRTAVAQRWITANPTTLIDNSKLQRPKPDPFTLDEAERIIVALRKLAHGEAIADYYEFSFFAGLRTSEQIALQWADVDLAAMTVRIHQARAERRDSAETKTKHERTVELNARAAAVITRQQARTRLAYGHVFHDPATGRGWHDNHAVWKPWAAAVKRLGVRYRPPKECRDTSVTLALQAGADPQYVAAQHGHSLAVMMRDYAKWLPGGDQGRNRRRIDAALGFATDLPPAQSSSN